MYLLPYQEDLLFQIRRSNHNGPFLVLDNARWPQQLVQIKKKEMKLSSIISVLGILVGLFIASGLTQRTVKFGSTESRVGAAAIFSGEAHRGYGVLSWWKSNILELSQRSCIGFQSGVGVSNDYWW